MCDRRVQPDVGSRALAVDARGGLVGSGILGGSVLSFGTVEA